MTRAAVYLRISNDDHQTGLAVERQREDALTIVAARGWTLAGEYVDNAISASKRQVRRPEYDRMEADFRAGRFGAIVCYDLDRLTRQPRQLEDWIDAAEEEGLILVTANGEADLSTDGGRLFARMKAAVARAEIERKGARQKRANIQRAQSGKPVPTRRRYGYETDGVTPREPEAEVVRSMFAQFEQGQSIRAISLRLQREKVPTGGGKSWPTSRVRYILNSPFYAGRALHKGAETESDTIVPIVSAELSEHVRAILADDKRRTTTGPKPKHLLTGIARCVAPGCNRTLHHLSTYACQAAAMKGHISILTRTLDDRVLDEVAAAILTSGPDIFDGTGDRSEFRRLATVLSANEEKQRATLAQSDEGLISPAVARQRLIDLRAERESTELAIDRVRIESAVSQTLVESAHVLLVGDVMTMSEWAEAKRTVIARFLELPIERQREVVRALVAVTVAPGRDPRRIQVEHLIATHLNSESSELAEDFGGESAGPGDPAKRRAPHVSIAG